MLLCHMLHSLDPATIEMKLVNQKPALAQFLCLKNIRYLPNSQCFGSGLDPDSVKSVDPYPDSDPGGQK